MARVLITSGPTREYLDPVRFLSNASSGRMGRALAQAFIQLGHEVIVVSGPVEVRYPEGAQVLRVVTTEEMLEVCEEAFPSCDGVIGAAAPCDYRPERILPEKIVKSGAPLDLKLVETPDILATLGAQKTRQWIVGFALETHNARQHAIQKMQRKNCDLMVINRPSAIGSEESAVEVLSTDGSCLAAWTGSKEEIARRLGQLIQAELIIKKARG